MNDSINFDITDNNSFWKIHYVTFFPYKSIRDQIWPCRKIGHGQPRVIIWANLVVLEHPMIHTKFQGQQPLGSREEDFLRFLPYMGVAAILVMWPGSFEQTFIPPSHGRSTWNLASISLAVSKEKKFENGNLRDLGPRSINDLDLWCSYRFIKLTASINFDIIDYNSFWKIHCFTFFPYKSIRLGWAMVLGSFQCQGVLLLLHVVGQGLLCLQQVWDGWAIFFIFFIYLPFLMSCLLGDGWTWLKYCGFGC